VRATHAGSPTSPSTAVAYVGCTAPSHDDADGRRVPTAEKYSIGGVFSAATSCHPILHGVLCRLSACPCHQCVTLRVPVIKMRPLRTTDVQVVLAVCALCASAVLASATAVGLESRSVTTSQSSQRSHAAEDSVQSTACSCCRATAITSCG
jgi:hypothetical protein